MIHTARPRRTRPISRRPRLEWLETRIALSAIIATDPALGESLVRSPAALHVTFNQTIADYSIGGSDVILDRVNADGSLVPAFDNSNAPYEELDPDGTGLTFTLNETLAPGRYRLLLSGSSSLSAEDGTPLSPLDGMDETIGDFTIVRPGVGLADAIDLGKLGPTTTSVAGSLDLVTNPSDVKLYKITVPNGHSWRLGLEVNAARSGSSLNSALTLFDAKGKALATNDVGRPDAPQDPFLFAGLKPGTYYVGVSGSGNLPGLAGGYDIITSSPGNAGTQPGGKFTLNLVADEADLSTALIDFRVQHADPLDPAPTGLALRFNSPLDLGDSGLNVFDRATGGLELTDQNGRSWPLAAVNYDEAHGAIAYLFRDRLPQGIYTLRLASTNPLVDLAGHAPVSPTMAKGVLATFAVAPDNRARQADGTLAVPRQFLGAKPSSTVRSEDLGPLAPNTVIKGIQRSVTLQPGEKVVLRFVNLHDDFYTLSVDHTGGSLAVRAHGGGMDYADVLTAEAPGLSALVELNKGELTYEFTATGDKAVEFTVGIRIVAFSWDSLLPNGLGQGSALNLRLISNDGPASFVLGDTPQSASRALSTPIVPDGPAFGPSALTAGATTTEASAGFARSLSVAVSQIPLGSPGLALDIGGSVIGLPSRDADHVATVGPTSTSGAVALALAGGGPGQAITSAASLRGAFSSRADGPEELAPSDQVPFNNDLGDPPVVSLPAPAPEDAAVQIAAYVPPVVANTVPTGAESNQPGTEHEALPPGTGPATSPESEPTEETAAITPWIVGIAGVVTLGARQILRRWNARRKPSLPSKPVVVAKKHVPAPHSVSARVRV